MPAIIAHHLFGLDVYSELAPIIGEGKAERETFLLGNIGPDPLFCLNVLPLPASVRNIGGPMHRARTVKLLGTVHRHFIEREGTQGLMDVSAGGMKGDPPGASSGKQPAGHVGNADASVLRAYALGFLAHYFLDTSAHLLVYAEQYALCNEGIEGFPPGGGEGPVHALIEADLDEYLLARKRGVSIAALPPHRVALRCPSHALSAISPRFSAVVKDTYEIDAPAYTFEASVRLYRVAQRMLDSKWGGLRRYVDYGRMAGGRYLRIDAMSNSDVLRFDTPFANNEHMPWPNPFVGGAVVTESFEELYAKALGKALEYLPRFAQPVIPDDLCEVMTGGLNFSGRPADWEFAHRG